MANDLLNQDLGSPNGSKSPYDPNNPGDPPIIHKIPKGKNYYFNNDKVEQLLYLYHETECTNVKFRDQIMEHASELIRQIIRAHNLQSIYPGREESSFGDLFQVAWIQIESVLYKYEALPYCRNCYSPTRPSDSLLAQDFFKYDDLIKKRKRCGRCKSKITRETIYYKGKSKVFNMWCVSPDTMLMTNEGLDIIDNVVDDGNRLIYGLSGINGINGSLRKSERDTIKFTTEMGYNIECTPEHGLYVLGDGGPKWKKSNNIEKNDLLGIQYSQQYFINNDDISDISFTKRGGWTHPNKMNEELAYIIGIFIAEGSYSNNKLDIYNIDKDVIDRLVNNNLGLNFIHEPKFQRIGLCNARFIEFLKRLGFGERTSATTKFIPCKLLKCSKKMINSMLSGIFDGDGHSSRHNGCVGFTSSSKVLIDQVRMMLLNIGIMTKITHDNRSTSTFKVVRKHNPNGSWQLSISTIGSLLFYDRIGFKIKRKQDKMSHLSPPRLFIYGINQKFVNLHEKYGSQGHYNSIRRVLKGSKCTLATAVEKLKFWEKHAHDKDYKFINDRIEETIRFKNKIAWLPVRKIEKSKNKVCEISVDSEDHSYIANGIISHNSQVARTVILAYIKKEFRDKKNSDGYQDHLVRTNKPRSQIIERLIQELMELCKYNDEHLGLIRAIGNLCAKDDKPHEGLISKLVKESGASRSQVTEFLKFIRLRSFDFTDSPTNERPKTRHKPGQHDDEEDY